MPDMTGDIKPVPKEQVGDPNAEILRAEDAPTGGDDIDKAAVFINGLPEDQREDALAIISEAMDNGMNADDAIEEFAPQPEDEEGGDGEAVAQLRAKLKLDAGDGAEWVKLQRDDRYSIPDGTGKRQTIRFVFSLEGEAATVGKWMAATGQQWKARLKDGGIDLDTYLTREIRPRQFPIDGMLVTIESVVMEGRRGAAARPTLMMKLNTAGLDFGVDWEVNEKDEVVLRDVKVMGRIAADERPDFNLPADGVDDKWFLGAVKTFELMKGKGKFPRLMDRHNNDRTGEPADVIGRLDNVRWEDPWLVADAIVTNPDAIGRLARGEFPSRSAEFLFNDQLLWGLSLTRGEMGHFEEELPDLRLRDKDGLEELKKLSDDGTPVKSLGYGLPLNLSWRKKGQEDLAKLFSINPELDFAPMALVTELMQRQATLEEMIRKVVEMKDANKEPEAVMEDDPADIAPEAPEPEIADQAATAQRGENGAQPAENVGSPEGVPGGQVEDDDPNRQRRLNVSEQTEVQKLQAQLDEMKAEREAEKAAAESEKWINDRTLELVEKDHLALSADKIRAKLSRPKSQEAREEVFNVLNGTPAPPTEEEEEFQRTEEEQQRGRFEERMAGRLSRLKSEVKQRTKTQEEADALYKEESERLYLNWQKSGDRIKA